MIYKKTVMALALALSGASFIGVASADHHTKNAYKNAIEYSKFRNDASLYNIRASEIIGEDVENRHDETVGEIDDLVFSTKDNAIMVIISVGGFLGIGDKLVAVPYEKLRISADGEDVYFDTTVDILKAQPPFLYNDGEQHGLDYIKAKFSDMKTSMSSNWEGVEENWQQTKLKVQEKWHKLTDDDVDEIKGDREALIEKLRERYDGSEADTEKEVADWYKDLYGDS